MDEFLSDRDIANFLDDTGTHNIQMYEDITKYRNANQLFPGGVEYAIIFLPVTSKSVGHWQLLIKKPKQYYFFDSYGEEPNRKVNVQLGINGNLWTLLEADSKRELIINNVQYQDYSADIGTCGRWVLLCLFLFYIYKHFNFNKMLEVVDFMLKKFQLSPDEFVTRLINVNLEEWYGGRINC